MLALLSSCVADPEPAEEVWAVGEVSIANPGFERRFEGWTEVEPAAPSKVARSGFRSAKVSPSTGQVRQRVVGLAGGSTYVLGAWVQGDARVGVRGHGGPEVSVRRSDTGWSPVTVTFTTGAGVASAEIFAAWAGGGDARVDDFTLSLAAAPPAPPAGSDLMELTPGASAATASTSDANVPANAVDGRLDTRWSGYGDGAWLRLDLGAERTVGLVKVAVYNGGSRRNRFELQVSHDGAAWTTVWSGESSGTTTALETYDFGDSAARYVRYVGHGYVTSTGSGLWNSVTEIEVHGLADGGPGPGPSDPPPDAAPASPPDAAPASPPDAPTRPPGGCAVPADVLDLTNWKVTLPIGSPTEIKQPQLDGYAIDPWFVADPDCGGVQFRAHTSGATTSGSSYPRSELREMTGGGASNASWTTTSGTHRMYIDQAITAVPRGKQHVVAGQVHDASDDVIVIRLEYPKLFVDVNGTTGPTLDANYTLGKRFTVEFVASDGAIKIYYNGSSTPAYTLSKSTSGCYFKAGAYTQSNCTRESEYGQTCGTDNFGEVHIYDVRVTHQ